jgi:low temperature requirement protein LtrA
MNRADRPVSTLELFFDLVFVFAITQLTAVLADDPTPLGVLRVLLVFGVLWWMFGGYVWLTNAVAPDRPFRKVLLLLAMGGFLALALAIPTAFEGDGLIFAFGYLLVILIHAGLFTHASGRAGLTGIFRVAPLNIVAALVLMIAGTLDGSVVYAVWALAFGLEVITSFLADPRGFRIAPGHFVERHGLLLIIVLGESVVAIGVGAAGQPLDASLLTAGTLALAVVSCLWWLYFNEDDAHAEEAMTAAPVDRRMRIALNAFFYAQIPMLLGIVGFAAGVKSAIGHAFEPLSTYAAVFLAAGVALYLSGAAIFRLGIGWGRIGGRAVAAAAALLTAPIGLTISAAAQLTVLVAVLLALVLLFREGRPAGATLSA